MEITAKELRLRLSDCLRRVARGHTLDISMRGRRIARLTPVSDREQVVEDDLFGIWADREAFDANAFIRGIRKGRSL